VVQVKVKDVRKTSDWFSARFGHVALLC